MQAKLTRRAFLARASAAATGLVILGLGFRCGTSPAGKVAETVGKGSSLAERAAEQTIVSEATREATDVVEELMVKVTKTTTVSEVAREVTEVIEQPMEKVTREPMVSEVTEEVPEQVTEAVEGPPKRLVGEAETCLACRECEVACSLYHEGKCNPALSTIEVDFDDFAPGFPEISISDQCDLCRDRPQGPVCVAACPAGSLTVVAA